MASNPFEKFINGELGSALGGLPAPAGEQVPLLPHETTTPKAAQGIALAYSFASRVAYLTLCLAANREKVDLAGPLRAGNFVTINRGDLVEFVRECDEEMDYRGFRPAAHLQMGETNQPIAKTYIFEDTSRRLEEELFNLINYFQIRYKF